MHTGHYISGAGHLTLIGWVLLGSLFSADHEPFEMPEVSVISGADFDAILAAQQPPDSATDVAQPEAPNVTPDVPEVAATPDEAVQQPAPQQAETPPEDTAPQVTEQTPPPQAEVSDVPPELDQPVGDVAVLVPERAPEAVPRPVERVAPQAVAQPDPDVTPDPVEQQAVTPDQTGETPQDTQEAQAPEEATSEIVTEATAAPKASPRPPGKRPTAPEQQVVEAPSPSPSTDTSTEAEASTDDDNAAAIAAAVASAQSEAETPAAAAPSGPPLSAGEKEGLRVAVSNCWNVDVGGQSASTVVTVAVSLDRTGKVAGDVKLIGSEGGDDAAVRTAFGAARRAILRCQKGGFPLPADKYEHWKVVEMTFNPEKMRVK